MDMKIRQFLICITCFYALLGFVNRANTMPQNPLPCGLRLVQQIEHTPLMRLAGVEHPAMPTGNVRVTFVDHSTFQLETPLGVTAATDYAGFHVPGKVPTIVTMNNSHSSHYTDLIDPEIKHVLRGWHPAAGMVRHSLHVKDMSVYNVPTNIFYLGKVATNGNSVFIYEAAGLCLAHLGHLHHFLSREQIFLLGRIDVLFVPIDGTVTLSHGEAMRIIDQIKPRVVVPMHMSFPDAKIFPKFAAQIYKVRRLGTNTIQINRSILPAKTEIWFLANDL